MAGPLPVAVEDDRDRLGLVLQELVKRYGRDLWLPGETGPALFAQPHARHLDVRGCCRLMSGVGSKGRFRRMQLKDGDLGGLRRREASGRQHIFELLAGPSRTDALLRLPDADDVKGTFADRTVVAQFSHASRTSATHDQRMRSVIRLPQLVHIAVETRNQHDSQCRPSRRSTSCGRRPWHAGRRGAVAAARLSRASCPNTRADRPIARWHAKSNSSRVLRGTPACTTRSWVQRAELPKPASGRRRRTAWARSRARRPDRRGIDLRTEPPRRNVRQGTLLWAPDPVRTGRSRGSDRGWVEVFAPSDVTRSLSVIRVMVVELPADTTNHSSPDAALR